MILDGIGASSGVAIGKVFIKKQGTSKVPNTKIENVEAEIKRFEEAKEEALKELQVLYTKAVEEVGEEHAGIFDVHQMLVQDLDLNDQVVNFITEDKYNAAYAVSEAAVIIAAMFESMDDPYLQERAADIRDISKRLIGILTGEKEVSLADLQEPVILVAKDLFPSDTIQMNKKFVLGFITEDGGKMSHSAILARTMQIPAVVGLENALTKFNNDDIIILDGKNGKVYTEPTEEMVAEWTLEQEKYRNYKEELQKLIGTPNVTIDGVHIEVNANIGSPDDIENVLANDAKGVGLFRSEFLYMDGKALPTEEMQYEAYKKVLEAMEDRVIIRTLDVGGDKELPYLNIPKEENPFLGYRAIRVCLDQPELFKTQLRALLRASVHGKLGIMFPMIATVDEIKAARKVLEETKQELLAEGIAVSEDIEVGMMIETPAAALVSDLLAKEVDFFSIGTNDLTQYTMAVDRMNAKIAHLYDTHNLAILRSIKMVADNAHKAGIWVGICGESAADTTLTETYLAMGIDELSVSAPSVLEVRKKIQQVDTQKAKASLNL
ncbi:phosphoenolpyruvate--protein phosphotransferase [Niameybacter massiliensis]|uniref:phosphoenolpyruvate--protein phosphotransferase n=1 Tax=Niameybacter massiliensis TaxID=1658108 RepID=UPI0006B42A4C|nr:phosphoenolpyruvate--protein phosphotransferase [Niameybacter massiliensis]